MCVLRGWLEGSEARAWAPPRGGAGGEPFGPRGGRGRRRRAGVVAAAVAAAEVGRGEWPWVALPAAGPPTRSLALSPPFPGT